MLRLGAAQKSQSLALTKFSKCLQFATATGGTTQDVKPFSEIPRIPEVPFLAAGWNYLPIIGKYNLRRQHKDNMNKYLQYGPIIREKRNRHFSILHVYEFEDMEHVYRHEGRYPLRMRSTLIEGFRETRQDLYKNGGIFSTNGPEWQEIRSYVQRHMMKPKAIPAYLESMDVVSNSFLDRILQLRSGNGGEVVSTLDELYKWGLETVGLVALDTRLGCLEMKPNDDAAHLIRVMDEIFIQILKLEIGAFPFWKYFSTPMYRKFMKNMNFFSDTVWKYSQQAKDRLKTVDKDREPTFLEMLLRENKDSRDATATILDTFLAGVDTTATTVGLTLYHLARNPEAQEKAYQEIKSVLQGKELTPETLNEVRYLKACVKESMRLTPVVIGIGRSTVEDIVLSGYQVPAGTFIFMQTMVSGLLAKNFPEPLQFRPERFLRGESSHHPFGFIPFSFGPRSCVGRRIAEQQMWTVIIRVLERFRLEYHHEEIDLVTRLITSPDRPLRIQYFDR